MIGMSIGGGVNLTAGGGFFGTRLQISRFLPDGQMMVAENGSSGKVIIIGVNEPHAIAKRIVREGLADVLAWLTPERRPNMTTGQEILDRLKGDPR